MALNKSTMSRAISSNCPDRNGSRGQSMRKWEDQGWEEKKKINRKKEKRIQTQSKEKEEKERSGLTGVDI